jgi:hypothetical protein
VLEEPRPEEGCSVLEEEYVFEVLLFVNYIRGYMYLKSVRSFWSTLCYMVTRIKQNLCLDLEIFKIESKQVIYIYISFLSSVTL